MNFGSLFAGIGGIDSGLERAGMTCAWQVDNDDFCLKVLTKHWPNVPKYGDIRNVGKQNLETVDLIAGGFPCQPYSVAGKRRGTKDDRHLWPEMLRVISELKPAWVLGENVPGIIPLFLDQAISDLEAEGYEVTPIVLPACAFDASHIRERLFIVAYSHYRRFCEQDSNNGSNRWRDSKTPQQKGRDIQSVFAPISEDVSNTTINLRKTPRNERPQPSNRGSSNRNYLWAIEPDICRVAHGVPDRVDRLKSLGNAVVPQVAEFIGRIIMEANQYV